MLNYDRSSKIDIISEGNQVISQIKQNLNKIKESKAEAIRQFEVVVDHSFVHKIKGYITLSSYKSISSKLLRTTSGGNILGDSKRHSINTPRKSIVLEEDTINTNQIKRTCHTHF